MIKIVTAILFIAITLNADSVERDCGYEGFILGYKYGLIEGLVKTSNEYKYMPTPKQLRSLHTQVGDCVLRCKGDEKITDSVYSKLLQMFVALDELTNNYEKFVLEKKVQFDYESTQLWDKRLEVK